jgi:ferredoxin
VIPGHPGRNRRYRQAWGSRRDTETGGHGDAGTRRNYYLLLFAQVSNSPCPHAKTQIIQKRTTDKHRCTPIFMCVYWCASVVKYHILFVQRRNYYLLLFAQVSNSPCPHAKTQIIQKRTTDKHRCTPIFMCVYWCASVVKYHILFVQSRSEFQARHSEFKA